MKRHGLAFKLALSILGCAMVVLSAVLAYNYYYSRGIILRQAQQHSRSIAHETTSRIDAVLAGVQKVATNIAFSLEDATLTKEEILDLNKRVLANNPEIYAMLSPLSRISWNRTSSTLHLIIIVPAAYSLHQTR